MNDRPAVSVIVPTRNRPDDIPGCVDSILANAFSDFELLVVDQSEATATEDALAPYRADQRLRYIRTNTRGCAPARNLGIAESRGDILAFTDDDCRVPGNWLASLVESFAADPVMAVLCGKVVAPEKGWAPGSFAATFIPCQRAYLGSYPPPHCDWGITANMAFRRGTFEQVGVFDPMLGAGSPMFQGGSEVDILIRVLRAGLKVVNAEEVELLHVGFRHGDDVRSLIRRYDFALGAAIAKHVLRGDRKAMALYVDGLSQALLKAAGALSRGRRPTGLGTFYQRLRGGLVYLRHSRRGAGQGGPTT